MLRNPRQEGAPGGAGGGSAPPSLSPRTPLSYQGDQHPNILAYVGMSKETRAGGDARKSVKGTFPVPEFHGPLERNRVPVEISWTKAGSERGLDGSEAVRASLKAVVVERAGIRAGA